MGEEVEHPFAWAKKIGINSATFNRVWNEGGQLKSDHLVLIVKKTGVSLNWLVAEDGPMYVPSTEYQNSQLSADEPKAYIAKSNDFVFIPQMGETSAGDGLIPDNTIEMRVAIRREWLQRKGNPGNMSLIRVSGDSMEPTLLSGDLVLVDHSRQYIDPQGGIYAIVIDKKIMVKRVQILYHKQLLKIISDNTSKYQPIEIEADQVIINGKAIWYGRELER